MKGRILKHLSISLSVLLLASLFTSLFTPFIASADSNPSSISAPTAEYSQWEKATNIFAQVLNAYPNTTSYVAVEQTDPNNNHPWLGNVCDSQNVVSVYFAPNGAHMNVTTYHNEYNQDVAVAYADDDSMIRQFNQYFCGDSAHDVASETQSSYGRIDQITPNHWGVGLFAFNGITYTYPSAFNGYQNTNFIGVQDPTTAPPVVQQDVSPNFEYKVDKYNLTITPNFNQDPDFTANGQYAMHIMVTFGTMDDPDNAVQFFDKYVDGGNSPDMKLTLDRQDVGTIRAWFVGYDDQRIGDTPLWKQREKAVSFKIDGSTYSGSTIGTTCDSNDFCTVPVKPKYKDCSTNNITITTWQGGPEFQIPTPATVACMVNNFWLAMSDFIGSFFKPATDPDNPFVNWHTDEHGLFSVITAPLMIFVNLQSNQSQCQPLQLPLPYVNRNIELPCMTPLYQTMFGSMFTMYQTIVSGIISYYVMLKMLEMVKGIKDPQNDKIEATAL